MWEYTLSLAQESKILDFPPFSTAVGHCLIKSVNFDASGLFFLQLCLQGLVPGGDLPHPSHSLGFLGRKPRNFETPPTPQEIRVFHRGSPQLSWCCGSVETEALGVQS